MTNQPLDPTDGPPDDALDRVLNDQALREAAVKASRQVGNCPVRSESHINEHEDRRVMSILSVFVPALRVVPPEGGPRPDALKDAITRVLKVWDEATVWVEDGPGGFIKLSKAGFVDLTAAMGALRASGAGTRQEEPDETAILDEALDELDRRVDDRSVADLLRRAREALDAIRAACPPKAPSLYQRHRLRLERYGWLSGRIERGEASALEKAEHRSLQQLLDTTESRPNE